MFQIWLSRVCSISEQRRKPVACRVYKNHTTIARTVRGGSYPRQSRSDKHGSGTTQFAIP